MGQVTYFNVGCKDCSIIQNDGATVIVDCGDLLKAVNYLPGNKKIDAVFITHQHRDHYEGLEFLKALNYQIKHLFYSPYSRRHGDNSVTLEEWSEFAELLDHFRANGTLCQELYRQDNFASPWLEIFGLSFWMLGPFRHCNKAPGRELHDASLVFCVETNRRKLVFTGDASDTLLRGIAASTKGFCGENGILHASHHGSINGAELSFIKEASPEFTVISTESGIHSNIPHSTALKRYEKWASECVYRTDRDGNRAFDI